MDKCLVVTFNDTVLRNQPIDLTDLVVCTIEEADEHMLQKTQLSQIPKYSVKLLTVIQWLLRYEYIIVHLTCIYYGWSSGREGLRIYCSSQNNIKPFFKVLFPFFHALNVCNTTSSIFGKSKKTFYDAWTFFPEITKVFAKLAYVQQKSEIYEKRYCLIRTIICCDIQCHV